MVLVGVPTPSSRRDEGGYDLDSDHTRLYSRPENNCFLIYLCSPTLPLPPLSLSLTPTYPDQVAPEVDARLLAVTPPPATPIATDTIALVKQPAGLTVALGLGLGLARVRVSVS